VTGGPGEAAFDSWTWVHLSSGMGLAFMGVTWWWALGLLIVYEVFEAALRRIKLEEGGLFEYESWGNIVADVVVGVAGWAMVAFIFPEFTLTL
jgi:hypothetical protein